MIARGDRRLGQVIETAWRGGARFDAWDEHLNWDAWMNALSEAGIDLSGAVRRERSLDEVLPWDHISCGVTKSYFRREYERAMAGEITHDCQSGCTNCGAIELLGCKGGV